MVSGETNLEKLLTKINPELAPGEFVYATIANGAPAPDGITALCTFREREATTLILERAQAERYELEYAFPCRMITLNVHSALEAVGFLARVAAALTAAGISSNTVSAYYHDHLFVPVEKTDAALAALRELAKS